MTLPDFLVLGAARSATTSLHYYLEQHPAVTMSTIKEPNFFAFDHSEQPPEPLIDPRSPIVGKSVTDRSAYERLFAHAGEGDAVGEASPLYLYVRESPGQIADLVPEPRLIAVVRNPVDRAYSHWLHIRRDHQATAMEGFRAACEAEMASGRGYTPYAGASHVLRMGLYDEQIERYVETFGRDRLLVLTYETLVADPAPELRRICDHLGIARHRFDTGVRYNRSGVAANRATAAVMGAIRSAQPRLKALLPGRVASRLGRLRAIYDQPEAPPPIPEDLRHRLVEWFAPSVQRLRDRGLADVGPWDDFPR